MADVDTPDLMDYQGLAQEALRGVVRAALERAGTPEGLPGAHHLYISFRTTAPGVSVPPDLLARYPEDMTIVLQHQFWDLEVGEQGFSVMLKFGGSPKRLQAPYAAVTRFYDPSVQFMLQFEPAAETAPPDEFQTEAEVVSIRPRVVESLPTPIKPDAKPEAEEPGDEPPPSDGPKIVSLDRFRKK